MPTQPLRMTRVTAAISSSEKFGRPKTRYSERTAGALSLRMRGSHFFGFGRRGQELPLQPRPHRAGVVTEDVARRALAFGHREDEQVAEAREDVSPVAREVHLD